MVEAGVPVAGAVRRGGRARVKLPPIRRCGVMMRQIRSWGSAAIHEGRADCRVLSWKLVLIERNSRVVNSSIFSVVLRPSLAAQVEHFSPGMPSTALLAILPSLPSRRPLGQGGEFCEPALQRQARV